MRKLKKALSLVLAIALVLGLGTIGAAAIEIPNGVYEGGLTIEYHVTANDLSRLLAVEGYGANAEVDDLRLIFKDDLTPGIDSLDLIWNEASDSYGSVAYSNYMDVQPNCIKSLAIELSDGRSLEVSESDLTANYIETSSHIYELSLTEADETYLVTFWAQQGNDLHWTRYSVVAVEKGGTVGNKMPADPDTGNYVFIGWELGSHNGSGSKFTADTAVNSDIDVYARKVSVGGGSAYHVMNPDTELNAYAAAELGAASAEAVTIDSVRVNGQDEEATNPSYITNGWEEHNGVSYFYIYNDDAYAASFDPQYNNTRVPANEVTSITLFCTLNGEQKEVNIGIDELELAVVSDVIVEIRLHKSGDGDFIITASAGENGSISPVGNVSVAAGADQSFSFLPSDGFTVDTLTVNNTTYENNGSGSFDLTGYTFRNVQANGSIHVTFAADANDNDIPDYKEKKYGVTYEFVSGTDGKVLPDSGMPALPSDNSKYLTGITVTNKGESIYEAVSVDDGTWTFTGWDANEKVMREDGITFTGTWTFTETEKHPVNIVIYRNGDTDEEYSSTRIGEYAKGETVDLSKLNINDYYSSANGFVFEGWYNDGGWNQYKAGNPDNTLGDSITVNGWTNIICMVTDYEKVVVYSVVNGDKDNAETIYTGTALHGTNLIEYLDANVTPDQKPGYELDNWYNWDWYGHKYSESTTVNGWTNVYVTYTPVEPDAPTVEDLAELKLKVQIDCIDLGVHPNRDYDIEEGTFTTEIELVNGVWQCDLSVQGSDYLTKYISEFGKHEFSGSSTKTKTLVYGATGWTLENPSNDRIVFDVCCVEPDAPTYDVLKDMIKVQIDCINKEVSHSNADYDLIENSYDLGTLTANADGTWSCTLTVKSDAYVAKYNETKPGHTLVDAYASKDIELVYSVDGKWSRADTSNNIAAVFDVKCEAIPATPITPLPTEGDIAELIDGKIIVDCVNDDVNHANKNYGLVDDALMNVAMTDSTTVKVTLSANVYLAKYNDDDTSAKHSLADGQSETVTITLKYVDDEWTLPADAGELPATIKVVCETPVTPEPTPDITGFTKELVTDRRVYWNNGIAYPEFYRGDVIVDEGDSVTLIYKLTVTGTEGTEYTLSDAGAEKLSGSWSGTLAAEATASVYVSKTFSW